MNKLTINEIKHIFEAQEEVSSHILNKLQTDSRKGVQTILSKYYRKIDHKKQIKREHILKLKFENELHASSIQFIAGIDEVGRGPLAGPVVAASVILPRNTDKLIGINDSKKLSKKQREQFAKVIKEEAIAYSIIEIDNRVIDKVNILEATKLAMLKSVNELSKQPQHLLVDALLLETDIPQTKVINGDQLSLSIASASIIAKVHRDNLMLAYHRDYPEFGFEKNKGYGTKEHLSALDRYGYTPIHRQSFAPINQIKKTYKDFIPNS